MISSFVHFTRLPCLLPTLGQQLLQADKLARAFLKERVGQDRQIVSEVVVAQRLNPLRLFLLRQHECKPNPEAAQTDERVPHRTVAPPMGKTPTGAISRRLLGFFQWSRVET